MFAGPERSLTQSEVIERYRKASTDEAGIDVIPEVGPKQTVGLSGKWAMSWQRALISQMKSS
jgi:hypothetical protein